jgi:hypothetical protein
LGSLKETDNLGDQGGIGRMILKRNLIKYVGGYRLD